MEKQRQQRRGPGRPLGSNFRRFTARAVASAAHAIQQQHNREQTSIEHAREVLQQKREAASASSSSQSLVWGKQVQQSSMHVLADYGDLSSINSVGDELQHKFLRSMTHAMKSGQHICSDSEFVKVQLTDDFFSRNFRSLARTTGEHNISKRLVAIGQAILEMSYFVWNLMFKMILNMCSKGDHKDHVGVCSTRPLMTCIRLRYDETPSKVRVDDPKMMEHEDDAHETQTSSSCEHAKILQIECIIGVLLQDSNAVTKSTSHTLISGEVPAPLFALQSTSGQNIAAALRQVLQSLPVLQDVAKASDFSFRHSCSDAAQSNIKAERILSESDEFCHFTQVHTLCDIHKLYRATRASMKGSDQDVSGILGFSFALSDAGSIPRFHQALAKTIAKRLATSSSIELMMVFNLYPLK